MSAAPAKASCCKPGMFFTVEPMINLGRPHVKVLSDGWTAVTRDRSLSAQFEHTVGVTDDGVEIFTLSPQGPRPAAVHGAGLIAPDALQMRGSRHPERLAAPDARPSCGRDVDAGEETARQATARTGRSRRRTITAIASGCATRFRDAGADARQRLRAARAGPVPRHPAARREAARQGPDREVRLVRRGDRGAADAAARGQGPRRRRHHRAQDRAGRRQPAGARRRSRSGRCCRRGRACSTIAAPPWRSPTRSSSASCSSTSATS